jgi:transcriptional regulator with XRE-family HTH domain
MNAAGRPGDLSYEARARLADNLFLLRKRAGYSQEALGMRAMVSPGGIGDIENGKVLGLLDTYVRLAGGLGITLDDLLAGVTWTPAVVELEYDAGYEVKFDRDTNDQVNDCRD